MKKFLCGFLPPAGGEDAGILGEGRGICGRSSVRDTGSASAGGRARAYLAAALSALCFLSYGCSASGTRASSPTGYPSGEVPFSCVMAGGKLYRFDACGWDRTLPEEYRKIGEVLAEDGESYPDQDFEASHLEAGALIYAKNNFDGDLYVENADGAVGRYELWKDGPAASGSGS